MDCSFSENLEFRNEKRVGNRVKNQKEIKKKEELSAPTRRRRPLVSADHRVGPPPPPTSPIGEEDRTGERREYFVGRKEKREKGNERMR